MAVVNSEEEAETLRNLYLEYGPAKIERDDLDEPTYEITPDPPSGETTPEPADANVHIGFHDIFIEGEYLTVRSK
jgi:hypothetical protein